MSAVAPGNSASRRLADEVLGPLLARLTTLKTLVRGEDQDLLEKIERELAELKDVVSRVEEREMEIRYSFDPIERHIDDALRGVPVASDGIRSKLSVVDAELDIIKAKVRTAYNLSSNDCCCRQEDGSARQSQTATLARRREMEMIRHQQSPQMRHLRLAVGGFEERLRGCVLCLAAFVEDDITIKKRLLIHWWIGEGFVESSIEGNSRFGELVDKGFLTPLPKPHCSKIHRCKMLPWMQRDLLPDMARRSAFLDSDLSRARRAILQHGRRVTPPFKFNPAVRAIYNISQKYVQLGEGWFAEMKELRTLQLGQWRQFGPLEQIADPIKSHIEVSGTEHLADLDKCTNLRNWDKESPSCISWSTSTCLSATYS
ncbi:unnamed protein product [Urochloa decumbens]|uniref:Uncharacterized protein n=1 Tax=Urochloa decumbens TaxID=240449 RepID=A0ABC9G070_9POAL